VPHLIFLYASTAHQWSIDSGEIRAAWRGRARSATRYVSIIDLDLG